MGHPHASPEWGGVAAIAERQWGIVRRGDLEALGVHQRRVRRWVGAGLLHELHPGIYAVGHRGVSRRAEYLAAVWWCGGDAALSAESACAYKGWTVEDADHPPAVHVVTTAAKDARPGVIVHRTRRLPVDDVATYERLLRVTDDARTLIDRADALGYRELRGLADRLRSLPTAQLERTHARLPGRAGWRRTELLIHSEDARARSELERRFTRYLAHHALPQPDERNAVVAGCQADCVYHAPRLVVELDSRAHHHRRQEMLQDRQRDRRYRRAEWVPIRVMWEELELDDGAVAAELRDLFA